MRGRVRKTDEDVMTIERHNAAVMVDGHELCRGWTAGCASAVIQLINMAWEHNPTEMRRILEEAMKPKPKEPK